MPELPPRYEPLSRLGAGGGGEVWSVRDRVTGRVLALKLLASDAGESEIGALVREAIALSGLEGFGLPRVVAFGALRGGRRYMLRELVEGRSLDAVLRDPAEGPWLGAIATACDQLTIVHRAGLLHGDLKPANVIVDPAGRGTLVDLGLSAPWRDGGATAQGITPKYAAPELLQGEALTVRAEVYSLGATLAEGLEKRGAELGGETRAALANVAARATERLAGARWPSVDELASALRRAAGLPAGATSDEPPWPVLGLEATARALFDRVQTLAPGGAIVVEGAHGSGKSTLARRLAWALGIHGTAVASIQAPSVGLSIEDVLDLELGHGNAEVANGAADFVVIVDDADKVDEAGRKAIRRAAQAGARMILVGPRDAASTITAGDQAAFVVPPLDDLAADELVRRSVPSLPEGLRGHLIARSGGRPGALRSAVRRLAGRAIVSSEEIDEALSQPRSAAHPSSPSLATGADRGRRLDEIDRALDLGRVDDAARELAALGTARSESERVRLGTATARVRLAQGDAEGALAELASIEGAAGAAGLRRAWTGLRARASLRAGQYAEAASLALAVVSTSGDDALAADALSVRGVALAFTGDDAAARAALGEAILVARALGDPRVEAIAVGSAAIAEQRAGRTEEARKGYEAALAAAEQARDAATVATMRLNLAGLAHAEGDLGLALTHLEAAVDLGQRAGSGAALTQACLNLAGLDLYLGRWARARASLDLLAARRGTLSPAARAQLLGLEAEHAARTVAGATSAQAYEAAAKAWDAQGRAHDAAESRLEGLLARARQPDVDARDLVAELATIRAGLRDRGERGDGDGGFGEHAALAELVRGSIAHAAGDEDTARRAIDASIELARKAGRREWAWQALDARARLASAQGAMATARRDTEAALAMLEETAAKLPRDLREVFWDDPRRRALRQSHTTTSISLLHPGLSDGDGHGASISVPHGATLLSGAVAARGRGFEDRLTRILEITRELAVEHDVPRLLQRVTDHAVALLAAERGFVLLVGEAGELEAQTARTGKGGDDPHARFSRSVAEKVLTSGEPVVTISARDDERLAEAVSIHQLLIQSIACVPIRGAPPVGRAIGALYVETRLRPGSRFQQELPTLRAFADQAAIAIENARLLAENQARADELAGANVALATARDELAQTLGKRTVQLAEVRRDLRQVRAELRGHFGYAGLVGTSTAMRRLYALIERVKNTDVALLIVGESGTGKEMVARAVHQAGPRARQPFLGVNCGAIPANLLESELFGNVKGAFTGADRDRRGLFQEAAGGTLLLDEIGEMPHKMQSGLLRVLQDKRVRPVGGTREEAVDVRVIAATHCDLETMVAGGTFREDLYYRLNVVKLTVPPLRDRIEDIPALVDHFLSLLSSRYRRERKTLSRDALRKLCALPWPGNVRQLEHVLMSAWLMSDGKEIGAHDLELPQPTARPSERPFGGRAASDGPAPTPSQAKAGQHAGNGGPARAENQAEHKAAERERILGALTASNWNRAKAAEMIGVPRRTFYRRLKEFGLL